MIVSFGNLNSILSSKNIAKNKTKINKIVDYSLIAESEEYTAVPEFPFGSSILLVASLSAYIALTKNPVMVTKGLSHAVNPKWILSHFR